MNNSNIKCLCHTIVILFVIFIGNGCKAGGGLSFFIMNTVSISQNSTDCLKKNDIEFINPQAISNSYVTAIWHKPYYESTLDYTLCHNLITAKKSEMDYVDINFLACPNCKNGDLINDQLIPILDYINKSCDNSFSGRIWINLLNTYWSSNYTENRQAFESLLKFIDNNSEISAGLVTDPSNWMEIFGNNNYSYAADNNVPLMYLSLNGEASFDDWTSVKFGGYKAPYAKQYSGSDSGMVCGIEAQLYLDYSPYWN